MEKKSQKPYFIDYNFLTPQDLWQTHLVNTFAEGIHKIRCKNGHENRKGKACEIR